MTKFFMKWWLDSASAPATPQKVMELSLKLLEAVKAELSAGRFTEWGQFSNGNDGYAIIDGSEEDLFATMLKYSPFVAYEVFPVLSVEQTMEAVKKAAAAMQGK
jgi:hypothetical protein